MKLSETFFNVEPPGYAAISATLHLPYKPYNVSYKDVIELKHVVKDMNNNPDRYASSEIMEDTDMRSMVREKKRPDSRREARQ